MLRFVNTCVLLAQVNRRTMTKQISKQQAQISRVIAAICK
jgi:hypothetical protein